MITPGRTRTLVALVAALSAMTGAGWRAVAQVAGPTTTTAPTTTTVAPATTSTTHPQPTIVPPTKPPPPPAPKPTNPPPPTTTTTAPPPPPPVKPGGIPPDMQALINSIKRTGASNTSKLLDALRPLQDFGFTLQEAAVIGFGHFPVAGDAAYRDDFLEYRAGPPPHLHQGNDIWAQNGAPVRAPFDGTVEYLEDDLGGHGAYVKQSDGTYVYNAHLSAYVPNLSSGQKVKQGQVVGFVGNTGDAQGGPTHDHFEFHPKGGPAVDPKLILDGWINEALANAPALIASYRGTTPRAIVDTGLTRFDLGGGMFSAPSRPPAAPALWASSVSPTGAAVRMAEVEVADTFGDIDWDAWLRDQQAHAAEWGQADETARNLLAPLTPRPLAKFL